MRRLLIPEQISSATAAIDSIIVDFRGETMGTTWSVRIVSPSTADPNSQRDWQQGIQHQLDSVVAQMSHWLPSSDLSRFNRAAAGSWQVLPDAFFDVLSYAMSVAADSGGAYDPAAGALVNCWGFGPSGRYDEPDFQPPGSDVIEAARRQGGWQRIKVNTAERKIYQQGGIVLDLSAVAKGYSVDRIAQYLTHHGIAHFLVEVGGELRGAGIKPDQLPWWVALEQPPHSEKYAATASVETVAALHGLSIATSGDYRRFYRAGDAHCSHTIDPRTGYPIRNAIASVTVLHASCMAADALSTALTVLGVEDGLGFAEQHQVAARFLVRDDIGLIEHMSPAFKAMLQ